MTDAQQDNPDSTTPTTPTFRQKYRHWPGVTLAVAGVFLYLAACDDSIELGFNPFLVMPVLFTAGLIVSAILSSKSGVLSNLLLLIFSGFLLVVSAFAVPYLG